MHRLISLYNQNRRLFWLIVLGVIIMGFFVWRLIGMSTQNTNYARQEENTQLVTNNFNSVVVTDQRSVLSGENANIEENEISIIDNFISYCNSGKTAEAYKLISNECKEEMYQNLKRFEELYYKPVFGQGSRNASIENWTGNTYKVDLKEDALSTGKIKSENNFQDYITLTEDDKGNTKLNINNYIGRTTYDKIEENDNLKMKIIRADSYMDYEIYTFEVQNKLEQDIALGDVQDTEMSYLIDKNKLHYNIQNTELTQVSMTLSARQTKTVRIKYLNRFSSTREIEGIVFPEIILNYKLDADLENNYYQTTTIEFNL